MILIFNWSDSAPIEQYERCKLPNKEIETEDEDEDELLGFLLYKERLIFPKS
jgi:hypothetical protein